MSSSGSGQRGTVCVVGSEFLSSEMVELALVRIDTLKPHGTILVNDTNNNTIFKIHDTFSIHGTHKKRVLLDPSGSPILTLRPKAMSLHGRWSVYKGLSKNEKDLIFSAKHPKMKEPNRELNVFLANNKEEKICDFKIGILSSDFIYAGNSHSNAIAEMKRELNGTIVKVYPKVDQAFIIALIAILDGIKQLQDRANASHTTTTASTGLLLLGVALVCL